MVGDLTADELDCIRKLQAELTDAFERFYAGEESLSDIDVAAFTLHTFLRGTELTKP